MVDPQVLINCGIDSEKYTGFAFGMGIERQALRLFSIPDIRLLFENDVRFLKQFSAAIWLGFSIPLSIYGLYASCKP